MKKNIKYEEAVAEIQDIVNKMENGSINIDKMSEEKVRISATQTLLPTLYYKRKARETDTISSLSARLQIATARRL